MILSGWCSEFQGPHKDHRNEFRGQFAPSLACAVYTTHSAPHRMPPMAQLAPMPGLAETLPVLEQRLTERLLDFELLDEAGPHGRTP